MSSNFLASFTQKHKEPFWSKINPPWALYYIEIRIHAPQDKTPDTYASGVPSSTSRPSFDTYQTR